MPYQTLLYEKRDHIVTITLNRPERLNAFNQTLFEELYDALGKIEEDSDTRVWILTGAPRADGRPMFSAGLDLKARAERGAIPEWLPTAVMNRIDDLLKPSIAVIDGICTTGALEMALAFDIRLAADRAQFSDWHLKNVGVGIGMWGGGTRLSRLVGAAKAKQLILTGQPIDGKEAHRIGLVNEVYSATTLMKGALEMAGQIAAMRPDGVKVTLSFLDTNLDMQKHQALRWSKLIGPLTGIHPDADSFARQRTTRPREGTE